MPKYPTDHLLLSERPMKIKVLVIVLATLASLPVQADEAQDAKLKKLQDEVAMLQAQSQLFSARYPKFEGGKSGEIEGAGKLAGMASQHLPIATQKLGSEIGKLLSENTSSCSKGTVLISGTTISEKIAMATSFAKEMQTLDEDIIEAKGKGPGLSATVATIVAAVGSLVSYSSMFKTDYTVESAALTIDQTWLDAAILKNRPTIESERFPDRGEVKRFYMELGFLKERAASIKDPKKREELGKRADALYAAMTKPAPDGVLPIVTTALLSSITTADPKDKESKCLAVISSSAASPLLLTKETIFGKGAKAFVYLPVQASVVRLSSDGRPVDLICQLSTVAAPIVLSKLTGGNGGEIPWSLDLAKSDTQDCSATRSLVQKKPTE